MNGEDLLKTLKPGITVLELLCEINEGADRIRKHTDIEHKCDKVADIHTAFCDQHRTCQDHADLNECRKCSKPCLITAHVKITVFLGCKETVIALFEFTFFNLFVGKRFYHPDTG